MTNNPLVATANDTTSPLSGTGLLDDGSQLASAISSGDWVAGGMAAFSTAIDTVAAASDPLGTAIASGIGWLIDHFEPLKGWFDDLSGNASEVEAFSQTWSNVATALRASGDELTRVLSDVDGLHGATMDAYRRFQMDAAKHIASAGEWSGALGSGLKVASMIVQVVHDLLRDVLSQLVGSAISWASEEFFSFGLATTWVVEQVATRVSSLVEKVGSKVTDLVRSIRELSSLLDKLAPLIGKESQVLDETLTGAAKKFDVADQTTWPFDLTDPEEVYAHAFHNMDSDTAVLGGFEGADNPATYSNIAKEQGAAYFQLGTENDVDLWDAVQRANGLSNSDMFETVNKPFLDDVMLDGKTIHFTHSPLDSTGNPLPGRALGDEYRHIFDPVGPFAGKYEWRPELGPHGAAVPLR